MRSVTLGVHGLGHVPSFKNAKRIFRKSLVTRPDVKLWMDRCIRSFESQLASFCRTTDGAISTAQLQRFLTAWCPHDDCWQVIAQLHIQGVKVQRGDEGAQITIERL